jgi:hypothetical protein
MHLSNSESILRTDVNKVLINGQGLAGYPAGLSSFRRAILSGIGKHLTPPQHLVLLACLSP